VISRGALFVERHSYRIIPIPLQTLAKYRNMGSASLGQTVMKASVIYVKALQVRGGTACLWERTTKTVIHTSYISLIVTARAGVKSVCPVRLIASLRKFMWSTKSLPAILLPRRRRRLREAIHRDMSTVSWRYARVLPLVLHAQRYLQSITSAGRSCHATSK
jgi:hypothetical protein